MDAWACTYTVTLGQNLTRIKCILCMSTSSKESYHQNIPQRSYKIFHRIGKITVTSHDAVRILLATDK